MSQSLDELLEQMEREKSSGVTIDELRKIAQEDARQSAFSQLKNEWPQLGNLGKLAAKKTVGSYEVILNEHDDYTVEADEIVFGEQFVTFKNDNQVNLIIATGLIVAIRLED